MTAAERHVLDVVPVGLQVWEAVGDDAILRYANDEAKRLSLPDDAAWRARVLAACRSQLPGRHGRVQLTPLGGSSVLVTYVARLNADIIARLHEGVVVLDAETRVALANNAAAQIFGVPLDELIDRRLNAVAVDLLDEHGRLLGNDRLPLMRALGGEEVSDELVRFVRRDGTLLWVEVHANPLYNDDGTLYGAVASYDDVTARVEQDRRTRQEADTDALTGLANRRSLERTLAAALARAAGRAQSVGLLMLDLDGFKAINDTHGHAAGDEALREVARRLRRCVRERDLVARLGGDEFVVVLTDVGGRSGAVQDCLQRIREALREPFALDGALHELGAAVGVATFPADGGDAAALLAHADRNMYAAKGARVR